MFGPASIFCNSCLCNCCFDCLKKVSSQGDHRNRLFGYYMIFAVYYGLGTLVMYTFGHTFMKFFERWIKCPSFGSTNSCFGAALIIRISLALLVLYVIVLLLMLFRDDFSYNINKSCWIFKYLLPVCLTFAFFFANSEAMETYAKVCQYGGFIYLIVQDLAFNEYFIRFSNGFIVKARDNYCYKGFFWLGSLILLGVTILLVILNFTYNFNCGGSKAIVIINILLVAAAYVLTLFRTRNDVNVFCTGLYTSYFTYFMYSGLSNDKDIRCTTLNYRSGWVLSEIFINVGLITMVFLLMTYSREMPVFKSKSADDGPRRPDFFANTELRDGTVVHEQTAMRGGDGAEEAQDKLEYRTMKFVWLFLCYCLLTMYFLGVVTNYGTVSIYRDQPWYLYSAQAGYYIKIINGFIAALLYLWILIAPLVLRNRYFGYDEDPWTGQPVEGRERGTFDAPIPKTAPAQTAAPPVNS